MSSTVSSRPRRRAATAVVAAAVLALTACSGAGSAAPDDATGSAASPSGGAVPAAAATAVEAAYAGTSGPLPDAAPAVSPGHKVWVVSAFQQVSGLAKIASEIEAGSKVLGWTSSVCDGQNDPAQWATCVRQGTAAGSDVIVLAGVDCAPVAQPLAEAKKAGVLVAGISAFDCSDATQGGSAPLFDVSPSYGDDFEGTADFFTQVGRLRADYVIARTQGRAKVLHVAFQGVSIGEYLSKGFTEGLATCAGCEVVGTVAITPADVPNLRQKFDSGYLQAASANAVVVDLDFMLSLGVQQSLEASKVTDKVVLGGECVVDTIAFMRAGGGVNACIGFSNGRTAWSLLDSINRTFQKQPTVQSTIGWQLYDETNKDSWPADKAPYEGPVDYRAGYTALWTAAR
ncbi:substrate-binding domain-containing protein [Kineosporia sp. A_224]|uniref:substrate-binding domain-containing protein n=1 Tax=Kineosporia sp. A_224 TaxID=1962180 RepID=UPI001E30A335|nr:substrate-binding domain-containing protein [Kineosporia sp. A_224]